MVDFRVATAKTKFNMIKRVEGKSKAICGTYFSHSNDQREILDVEKKLIFQRIARTKLFKIIYRI